MSDRGSAPHPVGDSPEDADVRAVIEAELELLRPATATDRARIEQLLAPDFREVGASGRLWDRTAMVEAMVAGPSARSVRASDIEGRRVGADLVLVTCVSISGHRRAHRTSLWRRYGRRWRIVHHQGTFIPEREHDPG
ncbi:DUF4440 domain-containing protein [Raineyella fluvialis]|uniref:DUF4440 domain-containing protein n=1 Tax=Raineyella fluvialis TaxID=2662261 RepID=A0A5Q2FCY7_9ACTN|nr:nuclear transport factor 2 family protein [Raineyella fluvialis]QGF24802.1 DUF4440 domain-containing protein [Raineyella fluvialis]